MNTSKFAQQFRQRGKNNCAHWAWLIWLLIAHIALVSLLLNSQQFRSHCEQFGLCTNSGISPEMLDRREFIRRQASTMDSGFALFLGDSHVESLAVQIVEKSSLNAGIGGDTSRGVLERLGDYTPIERWKYVFLWVGFNDLQFRQPEVTVQHFRRIIDLLRPMSNVIVMELLPIDERSASRRHQGKNAQIQRTNAQLQELSLEFEHVLFLKLPSEIFADNNELATSLHIGDGVHLNEAGRKLMIRYLHEALSKAEMTNRALKVRQE